MLTMAVKAAETVAESRVISEPITPPRPLSETAAEPVEDDPFDDIFRIFNKR